MRLVLATGNIMGGSPSVVRQPAYEKSNAELISSLRANFSAARSAALEDSAKPPSTQPSFRDWTTEKDGKLYIPSPDPTQTGVREERPQYDITVKLFYLPNTPPSCRCAQTHEAISLVLGALNVSSIDLLIVSFPGITFDAEDDSSDSDSDPTPPNTSSSASSDLHQNHSDIPTTAADDDHYNDDYDDATAHPDSSLAAMIPPWRTLESLHAAGVIERLGIAEFGAQRLARLLARVRVRPRVDQINVRDCCVVPKPLILLARREGVELLTHNDCTNILPQGTLRELLGAGEKGFGVLAPEGPDGVGEGEGGRWSDGGQGLRGDVRPEVVVKYTAVVKDTGVVENKGYFAVAELREKGDEGAVRA